MRLAITESALKQLGKLFIERMKNENRFGEMDVG